MRIYLDLCCLKRPFDAQDQPLVRLQTDAVISILALPEEAAELVRAPAQARFLTVDLPLLKLATRLSAQLRVRVADPVSFLEEISQWTH